jgi:maltose/maltodextrin transport system substrate-binding protein
VVLFPKNEAPHGKTFSPLVLAIDGTRPPAGKDLFCRISCATNQAAHGPPNHRFKRHDSMRRYLLLALVIALSSIRAFAWVDGEVLVWIGGDKAWRGLAELGKKFESEFGIPVKVEPMDGLTDKFQSAAQGGKGPDIVIWAHDRLGEWADAGLLKPLEISEEFKAAFLPMTWDAVSHNKKIWGYPLAVEAISLIYNKQLVTGTPPRQLSDIPAFAKELKAQHPKAIPIMWDYKTPYFSWPFLVSDGGYAFKKVEGGYDVKDSGVNVPGAVKGLQEIVDLINSGIMPKGATYSIMGQKMCGGDLAMMISGPWSWVDLRKCGVDFDLAPLPGVGGKPGRPFVGVLSALINRASPNGDLAAQFLEKYVCTDEGLKTMDADVAIGVPALKALADEMSAKNHLIQITYENALNGVVMPNVPQIGKFWGAMAAALEVATNGQATPQAALDVAEKTIEK